jgi:16S rRNA (cytosine967-C5)-methyltransferase
MSTPFCDHHIASFFTYYSNAGKTPLDLALSSYFKAHRSLGSHDRKTIGEAVFGMVRWKTLLDHLTPNATHLERYRFYKNLDNKSLSDAAIPEAARLGVPEFLLQSLVTDFGKSRAKELCEILNTEAPTTIRANLLKTTKEELLVRFAEHLPTPCPEAPHGIRFPKRLPLFSFPEFKEGLFEVQDEGSQIVSSLVAARPGEAILDFCSGSGGKTLAFAPAMLGKGQIYLHDIREGALLEAKKRLRRAGVQNVQFLPPGHTQLARIKGRCDSVLIDVPCSGTGTLRRNPDQKWNLDEPLVARLVETQKAIAQEAIKYLKPGGRLVYVTCSLLSRENQAQVDSFLASFPLTLEAPPLFLPPVVGGMDGFFAAVFKKSVSKI